MRSAATTSRSGRARPGPVRARRTGAPLRVAGRRTCGRGVGGRRDRGDSRRRRSVVRSAWASAADSASRVMRSSSTPVPTCTFCRPRTRWSSEASRSTLRTRSSGAVDVFLLSTPAAHLDLAVGEAVVRGQPRQGAEAASGATTTNGKITHQNAVSLRLIPTSATTTGTTAWPMALTGSSRSLRGLSRDHPSPGRGDHVASSSRRGGDRGQPRHDLAGGVDVEAVDRDRVRRPRRS